MSRDGKVVVCTDPDSPHTVDRIVCLLGGRPGCGTCPNRNFTIRFHLRVVDQPVACPRWASEEERLARNDPIDYVPVPRGICLTQKPFLQCGDCPNSRAGEAARKDPKWWEKEERARKIELELDEEERG
jgi:hypothetical protein